jgi:hypothetical protein
MRRAKIILGLAVLGLALIAGLQIASCELANLEFQSDLRDVTAEIAARIGLSSPTTDEELRNLVIRKAERYQIPLQPDQITVQHIGTGDESKVYLAADYKVRVNLLVYSLTLHFTPSSTKKAF